MANVGGAALCSTSLHPFQPLNRHWVPPCAIVNAQVMGLLVPPIHVLSPCPHAYKLMESHKENAMLVVATSALNKNGYSDVS